MPKRRLRFLPFVAPAEDRDEAFTKNMETAAVLCLAEAERDKGRSFITKKSEEKPFFIAEAYYPFWLVSWERRNLLFDGFGIITSNLSYDVLPDIQVFINELQGSAETYEAYSAFLTPYLNYFHNFAGKRERKIEGLISDPQFLEDFSQHLTEVKTARKPVTNKVILSPSLDKSTISSSIQELEGMKKSLMDNVRSLRQTMKLLNKKTEVQIKALREEIQKIEKEFDKRIANNRSSIMMNLLVIKKEYDEEITKRSKLFDQQLQTLQENRIKDERSRDLFPIEIERCEAEIRSSRLRKDEAVEARWRQDLKRYKDEFSNLEGHLKDIDEKINEVNNNKSLEISTLRSEYDAQAEAALRGLEELEASREAEIQLNSQKINRLEELSSQIINQLNKLLELKTVELNKFNEMGLPKKHRDYTLFSLPFYLVCYRRDMEKRYIVYPPSFVSSMDTITKLKSVFGTSKIKSLLIPRSKPIKELLNQLPRLIKDNPVFDREISDAGTRANILGTKEARDGIKKGLKKLLTEEWISENECQGYCQLLMEE
jgi:archaellum component FlaC